MAKIEFARCMAASSLMGGVKDGDRKGLLVCPDAKEELTKKRPRIKNNCFDRFFGMFIVLSHLILQWRQCQLAIWPGWFDFTYPGTRLFTGCQNRLLRIGNTYIMLRFF